MIEQNHEAASLSKRRNALDWPVTGCVGVFSSSYQVSVRSTCSVVVRCVNGSSWYNLACLAWRGAGVADRGGLENRCSLRATVGSNPTLSALNFAKNIILAK